jgi:hypothetical protein
VLPLLKILFLGLTLQVLHLRSCESGLVSLLQPVPRLPALRLRDEFSSEKLLFGLHPYVL